MKRRWIVRSFFLGLFLLVLSGWLLSYSQQWGVISYSGWGIDCNSGEFHLSWGYDFYEKGGHSGSEWIFWNADFFMVPALAGRDMFQGGIQSSPNRYFRPFHMKY